MNIFTNQGMIYVLQNYGYLMILILMIVEGPIITYAASFMASLGIFNIYIIFILSIFGNLTADIIFFYSGRHGKNLIKLQKKYKIKHTKKIVNYIEKKPIRSLTLIKLIPPFVIPGLILTGTTRISLKKFILFTLLVDVPYSIFFVLTGYYSGISFSIFSRYLKIGEFSIIIVFIIFMVLWFIIRKLSLRLEKKFKKEIEE